MLRRWLSKRRRSIFQFWDGTQARRIDPMAAYRAILEHPKFDWESHPKLIDVENETVSLESLAITADAVRVAFVLPAVAEGGLTELECVDLLSEFCAYLAAVKKNTSPTPISQPLSAPGPCRGCGGEKSTSGESVSGSMPTAPSAAAPSA